MIEFSRDIRAELVAGILKNQAEPDEIEAELAADAALKVIAAWTAEEPE